MLGTLSLWLEHVNDARDAARSRAVRAGSELRVPPLQLQRARLSWCEHRDGRPGNILVAEDDTNRRVFAVDNGISFGGLVYNFLTTNWDVIRVPGDPPRRRRQAARRRTRASWPRSAPWSSCGPTPTASCSPLRLQLPPIDPTEGVRVAGGRVQMGLTADEIDGVSKRLAALLEQVDDGKLAVF